MDPYTQGFVAAPAHDGWPVYRQAGVQKPQIIAQARTLLQQYPVHDDRFKVHMIHYLRETLPGGMEPLYEAMLKDIMADKLQLGASQSEGGSV